MPAELSRSDPWEEVPVWIRGAGSPGATSAWHSCCLAVLGKPACSVQVYVSLIKIKMSEGQRCTKSQFY